MVIKLMHVCMLHIATIEACLPQPMVELNIHVAVIRPAMDVCESTAFERFVNEEIEKNYRPPAAISDENCSIEGLSKVSCTSTSMYGMSVSISTGWWL